MNNIILNPLIIFVLYILYFIFFIYENGGINSNLLGTGIGGLFVYLLIAYLIQSGKKLNHRELYATTGIIALIEVVGNILGYITLLSFINFVLIITLLIRKIYLAIFKRNKNVEISVNEAS